MPTDPPVIENQFFVGVPWKRIRPKFEGVIDKLKDEYPVHCVIFGRNTGQDADDLWRSIQREIQASAATIFDVTGSNANVALEFGYAEALGKQRVLTRYERKARKGQTARATSSIMSDLAGKVRVPYKNIAALTKAIQKELDRNPYVVRFHNLAKANRWGKRKRKVAIAIVHQLDGGRRLRKPELTVNVETLFPNMTTVDIPKLIDEMGAGKLLVIKRGRKGGVYIPRL